MPALKLRTPTQSGTAESPRGNLLYASDVLDALDSILSDEETALGNLQILWSELSEQIELAPHALNHYK